MSETDQFSKILSKLSQNYDYDEVEKLLKEVKREITNNRGISPNPFISFLKEKREPPEFKGYIERKKKKALLRYLKEYYRRFDFDLLKASEFTTTLIELMNDEEESENHYDAFRMLETLLKNWFDEFDKELQEKIIKFILEKLEEEAYENFIYLETLINCAQNAKIDVFKAGIDFELALKALEYEKNTFVVLSLFEFFLFETDVTPPKELLLKIIRRAFEIREESEDFFARMKSVELVRLIILNLLPRTKKDFSEIILNAPGIIRKRLFEIEITYQSKWQGLLAMDEIRPILTRFLEALEDEHSMVRVEALLALNFIIPYLGDKNLEQIKKWYYEMTGF